MSKLFVDEIQPKTTGSRILMPQGSIIQTQFMQQTATSTQSISSQTDTILNNISVNITPASTSSIIKIEAQVFFEPSTTGSEYNNIFSFFRGSTKLGHPETASRLCGVSNSVTSYTGADAGSTPSMAYLTFFDTPASTSQLTYQVGFRTTENITFYLNRTVSNTGNGELGVSNICVTEIGG